MPGDFTLELEMDVNTQRPGGATIFHIICSKGNVEFADYLLSKVSEQLTFF